MAKIGRAPRPGDADAYYPVGRLLLSFWHRDGHGEIMSLEEHSGVNRYPFMIGFAVPRRYRDVYKELFPRRAFALNVPDSSLADVVARCETLHGTPGDKFAALGLTPRRALMTDTVMIDECPVTMECRLRHYWPVGDYDFIVGELVLAHTDVEVLERRRSLEWHQTPLLRAREGR